MSPQRRLSKEKRKCIGLLIFHQISAAFFNGVDGKNNGQANNQNGKNDHFYLHFQGCLLWIGDGDPGWRAHHEVDRPTAKDPG
jgi:hypothetical protein